MDAARSWGRRLSDLDYDDPKSVVTALRRAFYQLLGGAAVASVQVGSRTGVGRTVTFQPTDIDRLQAEIARLDNIIAARPRNITVIANKGWF